MIAVDDHIFVGTVGDGAFVSSDLGSNWSAVNNSLPQTIGVESFVNDQHHIFAGTTAGIYHSADLGSLLGRIKRGVYQSFYSVFGRASG